MVDEKKPNVELLEEMGILYTFQEFLMDNTAWYDWDEVPPDEQAKVNARINAATPDVICRWFTKYTYGDPTIASKIISLYKWLGGK